jgi:hypothetical protein
MNTDFEFLPMDNPPVELLRFDAHYTAIMAAGDTVKIVVPSMDGFCIIAPNPVQVEDLSKFISAVRDGLNRLQGH